MWRMRRLAISSPAPLCCKPPPVPLICDVVVAELENLAHQWFDPAEPNELAELRMAGVVAALEDVQRAVAEREAAGASPPPQSIPSIAWCALKGVQKSAERKNGGELGLHPTQIHSSLHFFTDGPPPRDRLGDDEIAADELCPICYVARIDTTFEPCGHRSCHQCIARSLLNSDLCFFCKAPITGRSRDGRAGNDDDAEPADGSNGSAEA